jgi:chromosome segregation ATPase
MGFGDTAKKLQKIADMAEDVYKKLNELRQQVIEMRETVDETKRRVDGLESETAEQRALLEAIAVEQGIDLDDVTAEAHITEAEREAADDDAADGATASPETGDGSSAAAAQSDTTTGTTDGSETRPSSDSTDEPSTN